jgi:hypothetical protein
MQLPHPLAAAPARWLTPVLLIACVAFALLVVMPWPWVTPAQPARSDTPPDPPVGRPLPAIAPDVPSASSVFAGREVTDPLQPPTF